ncbi:MAG: galactitol-1-phosphate 5-dehydrogenase [Lachnospiraceae bacterium]|nr:galactitol-1-phosphate 5-dehydrogenase [Lachnospiraceae bacterium]
MKAWVLHNVNDFRFEDKSEPKIKPGEVLVQVKAAGICGSDIPRVYETGAHVHPLVLGHEFAGQVTGLSDSSDEGWLGKRVGIFPLIPCGKCVPCMNKQYEMCRKYSYLGSRQDGGFAEYVAVPKANLIELPDNVTYEQAAMLEPMSVAVHAMRRGFSLIEGDISDKTVAVWGLGTIGLLLVMFLRQAGVRNILAIGNKAFQKEKLLMMGISEEQYCDVKKEDALEWISDKTKGCGVDLFFECVGKKEVLSGAAQSTAPAGGIVLVGNPYSDMDLDKAVYWKILRNQLKITGTWNSSFTQEDTDDWHYVIGCLKEGNISPENLITHRYTLEDLEKGFHIMRDKTEDYVKIMRSI